MKREGLPRVFWIVVFPATVLVVLWIAQPDIPFHPSPAGGGGSLEAPDLSTPASLVGTAVLSRLFGLVPGRNAIYRERNRSFGEAMATSLCEAVSTGAAGLLFRRRMVHAVKSGQRYREAAVYRVEPDRVVLVSRQLASGYLQALQPGQVVLKGPLAVGTAWRGNFVVREENPKLDKRSIPTTVAYKGRIVARESVKTEAGVFEGCWKVEHRVADFQVLLWLHPEAGEVRREGRVKGEPSGSLVLVSRPER